MSTDEAIRATLDEWTRTSHVYGKHDCLLSIANYGRGLSGVDIGAPWRDTYTTEAEALAIVRKAGGAVLLLGGALMGAGFVPVDNYRRGDALVVNVGDGAQVGALHLGDKIAMRLARGVIKVPAKFIKVAAGWRWEG
jgi:hypothetical protein